MLSPDQKKMLLIISQVARYSGLYWRNQMNDNFEKWFEDPSFQFTSENWISTVKIDTRGGLTGYKCGITAQDSMQKSAKGGPTSSARKILNIAFDHQ